MDIYVFFHNTNLKHWPNEQNEWHSNNFNQNHYFLGGTIFTNLINLNLRLVSSFQLIYNMSLWLERRVKHSIQNVEYLNLDWVAFSDSF